MSGLSGEGMDMRKSLIWVAFAFFVAISWTLAFLFLFTGGGAPCGETRSCVSDQIGVVIVLLLLPFQVGLAAFIKNRLKD